MKSAPHRVCVALLALAPSVIAAAPLDRADLLIAEAKAASGGAVWDRVVTWHETGRLSGGGLTGTYESWTDLKSLDNSGSFELGPISGGQGWDGKEAWTFDSSREVRIETSSEAAAQAIQDAWRSAYAFFFPQRFHGTRRYAGTRQAEGKKFEAVTVTPSGADPFEVWFDPTTHRIAREVQITGGHPHTFLFAKYSPVGGLVVPFQTTDRVGSNARFDVVTTVAAIELLDTQPASRYTPPPPPANSLEWPDGQSSVSVPFRLLNNHIYVNASINGGAPAAFIFDTGAIAVLDNTGAKRIGIDMRGALAGGGFGDQIAAFGAARVQSVSLGGLALRDQVFIGFDETALIAVEGIDSIGLLGYEFAKRAVLKIDYAQRLLTFTRPGAFLPPTNAQAIPFQFDAHVPVVTGALDGITGEFELDTGSRGALSVMAPFAAQHGLEAKYHAVRVATVGYGMGGPSRARLGRADTLTLGGVTIEAPILEFAVDKAGAAQAARTAGNIGGDILKRFTVTLDYTHRQVWLEPNPASREREVFDRSGLWIVRAADGAISISDVTSGSPAAADGLAAGDQILSVDDTRAEDIALYDLRERFKGPIGKQFKLHVRGKDGERDVILALADQV